MGLLSPFGLIQKIALIAFLAIGLFAAVPSATMSGVLAVVHDGTAGISEAWGLISDPVERIGGCAITIVTHINNDAAINKACHS